ncbi:MAG: hydroxyacid dehydrogenase [Anaerolineae bacterium]|nr:hydroxyacid dehydrogenase [Anaerolineae bacterium]NIN93856.1 hydroxyacid dehydrogenase [Anaerolineae bacterium]NIQ76891.1 hydroxyacid dehydrogenase [Anaerolineae bacterium]
MKILVTARSFRQTPGRHHELLKQSGHEVVESPVDRPLKESELVELIGDVDGAILGLDYVTAAVIDAGGQLKVLSRYGVGVDRVDSEAATAAGVVVTNTPGANHIGVAELTMGLMLSLARRIPQHYSSVRQGSWTRVRGTELAGKTLGIVGLGWISKEVIRRASAFDMRILVQTGYPDDELINRYGVEYVPLERILQEADYVSLHCAVTPERCDMIGEKELRDMKPGAYLVNTARGELVDEEALLRALQEGWIAGAAMDAFKEEPAIGHPLFELENFIGTPHLGATTYESIIRMGTMAVDNTLRVLRGERPVHVVNPEVYERLK